MSYLKRLYSWPLIRVIFLLRANLVAKIGYVGVYATGVGKYVCYLPLYGHFEVASLCIMGVPS